MSYKKFSGLGIEPTDFNSYVARLCEMEHKKSDSNNGYYIVADTWGTVFFRETKTKPFLQIITHEDQTCRTYTKIPSKIFSNVFFIYANYRRGKDFGITLPAGARIIGMQTATNSTCGEWKNSSALVYCPDGAPPIVEEIGVGGSFTCPFATKRMNKEDDFYHPFFWHDLMRGKPVRYMYFNEDGYVITQHNRKTA
jgi:hypothetical protein